MDATEPAPELGGRLSCDIGSVAARDMPGLGSVSCRCIGRVWLLSELFSGSGGFEPEEDDIVSDNADKGSWLKLFINVGDNTSCCGLAGR
jgi:hypothetical protein